MSSKNLDTIFFALSDPTRRGILSLLAEGDAAVGELAASFPMSQPAISKHLKILERAGLITRTKMAQRNICSVNIAALSDARHWIFDYHESVETNFMRMIARMEGAT